MLTSKIIKLTTDNLFQFDRDKSQNYLSKDTFALVWKVSDSMPPLSDIPACRYQQSLSRYITCKDVCVQESHSTIRL